jgi:uncharacterized protein YihD (DUF1040 family)
MIEALKRAIELAQQLPEEEQQVLAHLMLEEMQAEARWEQVLNDPRSEILLERMAEQAHQEYATGLTRDLDDSQ